MFIKILCSVIPWPAPPNIFLNLVPALTLYRLSLYNMYSALMYISNSVVQKRGKSNDTLSLYHQISNYQKPPKLEGILNSGEKWGITGRLGTDAQCIRRGGQEDNFVSFMHSLYILPFWKPQDLRR